MRVLPSPSKGLQATAIGKTKGVGWLMRKLSMTLLGRRAEVDLESGGSRMKWMIGLGAAAALAVVAISAGAQETAPLAVGDKAPNFKLVGTDGKTYTLDQFKGKSAVVIAWCPKALTGG